VHRYRWEWLPHQLGFGCGMTCWRRLRDWNNAGVWQRLHEVLLAESRAAGKLDLRRPRLRHDKYRALVRELGVTRVIARRGTEHGSGLGKLRWVVEQSFALLHWFRRLRIRWEFRDDIHEALLKLGCALIRWHRLQHSKS
jgi:transposase